MSESTFRGEIVVFSPEVRARSGVQELLIRDWVGTGLDWIGVGLDWNQIGVGLELDWTRGRKV